MQSKKPDTISFKSSREPLSQRISKSVLDYVFPRFCINCHSEGSYLCPSCQDKIIKIKVDTCLKCQKITPNGICNRCTREIPLTRSIILGYHRDQILKEAIHNLKYEGLTELADTLSNILIQKLQTIKLPKDAQIIPVPLHISRLRNRGFNQSELIANKIGSHFRLQVNKYLLKRTKNTKPQIELKHNERQKNIQNAFQVNNNSEIPKIVILLDDVITTGATIGECARTLRASGVRYIWLIALAHG